MPYANARALVPAAYKPQGLVPNTADVYFVAVQCGRVSTGSSVLTNVGYMNTEVAVTLTNPSWADSGPPSRYFLDFVATSKELAAALQQTQLPVGTADLSITVQGAQGPTAQAWKYVTSNWTLEFEFPAAGDGGAGFDVVEYAWLTVPGGQLLLEKHRAAQYKQVPISGVARTTGTSSLAQLNGACCPDWTGRSYLSSREIWSGSRTTFRG